MPELRKDPLIDRWVIIATERAKRPMEFHVARDEPLPEGACPFCVQGTDRSTGQPEETVRIVPSLHPVLRRDGDPSRRMRGMYQVADGIGVHEVLIESVRHISNAADLPVEQLRAVLGTLLTRMTELARDPLFRYALWFKNYGALAGAGGIQHAHSQVIATPVTPLRVKEELVGARRYFAEQQRCLICDLLRQEQESQVRVVADFPHMIAICPFASRFPFEMWILPKRHACDFTTMSATELSDLASILKHVLSRLKTVLDDPPYNVLLHTAPFRHPTRKSGYWKTVEQNYHWHLELIPRLTRVAGFEWGTGSYINPTLPEEAATYLRMTDHG